jgi:transcription initiation factor TFIID subunit 1
MIGLPDVVEDFDYGLKTETEPEQLVKRGPKNNPNDLVPDDAFLMVTQVNWEDDVIWNGDDIKHKVLQKLNSKTNAAGWVPSSFNRTAGGSMTAGRFTISITYF